MNCLSQFCFHKFVKVSLELLPGIWKKQKHIYYIFQNLQFVSTCSALKNISRLVVSSVYVVVIYSVYICMNMVLISMLALIRRERSMLALIQRERSLYTLWQCVRADFKFSTQYFKILNVFTRKARHKKHILWKLCLKERQYLYEYLWYNSKIL